MFYKKYSPNPRLERKNYEFLCGEWDFAFADASDESPVFDKKITVPYTYESAASGIGDTSCHECVWYGRTFNVKKHGGAVLLHFEGVDYHCFVYVNGKPVGEHVGGFTKFCLDVTAFVREGDNDIMVKVLDSLDKSQLRGKQRAREESYDCWYVQTTGIWKPVWIEYAGSAYIKELSFKASVNGEIKAFATLNSPAPLKLAVYYKNELICDICSGQSIEHELEFTIKNPKLWSGDSPELYTVKAVAAGEIPDEVNSYFGICEVKALEDGLHLNGKRVYQQMILYQGYWEDTMLSAPDDESIERDLDIIKEMGFNGVRVHQKVENEVFYYLCDKKGIYVFGEIPSAYEFTDRMKSEFSRDCALICEQLRHHVCVVTWLLFNETWGVYGINEDKAQQSYIESVAAKIRKIDNRPVITNDGWYHLDSDILSLHEYEQDADVFSKEYKNKSYVVNDKMINENKYGKAFAKGYKYAGQPVFISEYGGIAIQGNGGWGYGDYAPNTHLYEQRLRKIVGAVLSTPYVSGCCYTQFNDTQQEVNGLLDSRRNAKLPVSTINSIFAIK